MRFLVTGATGFVGGAVARHLLGHGHSVRALLRRHHDPAPLAAAGMEPFLGDLLDQHSLDDAVRGVDGVFHAAANYSYWARVTSHIYDTNVKGTEAVLAAARGAGVRRVVFTSSVGTLGAPAAGELADESLMATMHTVPDHYHRSKLIAEEAALAANGGGMEVVAVNPTTPIGPGDVRPTPTGRIVLEFLRRRTPGYVEGTLNLVDVDDVAAGHLAAFERGRPGERYILGGINTTLSGAYSLLARATGLRRRPVRIPYMVAVAAARLDGLIEGRLLRRPPYIPLDGLRALRHSAHVDCAKAGRDLGYRPGPVLDALGRAAQWFVDNGYVRVRGMRGQPVQESES